MAEKFLVPLLKQPTWSTALYAKPKGFQR